MCLSINHPDCIDSRFGKLEAHLSMLNERLQCRAFETKDFDAMDRKPELIII